MHYHPGMCKEANIGKLLNSEESTVFYKQESFSCDDYDFSTSTTILTILICQTVKTTGTKKINGDAPHYTK